MDEAAVAALAVFFLLVLGGLLLLCCYYLKKRDALEKNHISQVETQHPQYNTSDSTSWTPTVDSSTFYREQRPVALLVKGKSGNVSAEEEIEPQPPKEPPSALLLSLLEQRTNGKNNVVKVEDRVPSPALEADWDGAVLGVGEEPIYGNEELQVGLLYLESLNELVVTIRQGKNFDPLRVYKVSIRLLLRSNSNEEVQMRISSRYCESRAVTGQQDPRWNEHLSFEKLTETALDTSMSLRIAVLREVGRSAWEEIGWIVFSTNSVHSSGRRQWLYLLSKEGFVTSWHYLATTTS